MLKASLLRHATVGLLLQNASGSCVSPTLISSVDCMQIQQAESWKYEEIDLDAHMNTSSKLTEALSTANFPYYNRHETAEK